jgi:hypothetical protein
MASGPQEAGGLNTRNAGASDWGPLKMGHHAPEGGKGKLNACTHHVVAAVRLRAGVYLQARRWHGCWHHGAPFASGGLHGHA